MRPIRRCRRWVVASPTWMHCRRLLVVGSNLRRELPLLAHRVRKAAMAGAKVWFLNPREIRIPVPGGRPDRGGARWRSSAELNALLSAAGAKPSAAPTATVTRAAIEAIVEGLRGAASQGHLAGRAGAASSAVRRAARGGAVRWPRPPARRSACWPKVAMPRARTWLACCRIVRPAVRRAQGGLNAGAMLSAPLGCLPAVGFRSLASDTAAAEGAGNPAGANFVVAATPFVTDELKSVAHVLLPIGSFAETSGTYVNLEGQWQSFAGAAIRRWASRGRAGRCCACWATC